jgi:hypothetical protein
VQSLDEPTLIARKVAETPWAFYCAIGYAERYGAPRTMEEALGCPLAIPAGQAEEVFRELRPDANVGYSTTARRPWSTPSRGAVSLARSQHRSAT